MQLCGRILRQPILQCVLKKLEFANFLLVPPLDFLFWSRRRLQSLLGFHTLVYYYLSPLNCDMRKLRSGARSMFEHALARIVHYQGDALSYSLSGCLLFRCYYFPGRNILAKSLKIRCCIDCNLSNSESLTELAAHKAQFPFEFFIRRFLLQKLSSSKKD